MNPALSAAGNFFAFAAQSEQFLTAAEVGILPMLVNFTFFVAYISMGAAFVFFLVQRGSVAPEYKTALTISALVVGIAAFHYFYMKSLYGAYMPMMAQPGADSVKLAQASFLGIISYRYMDWLITTPLLVAKIPMALSHGRKIAGTVTALMVFDVLMIVAGFIGEQQLNAQGIMVSNRLIWGTISTIGYLGIVYILLTTVRGWASTAEPEEKWAVKAMTIFVLTGWGIYPVGYLVPVLFPNVSLDWVHLVYNIGDQVNKIGPGIVLYLAGRQLLTRRAAQGSVVSSNNEVVPSVPEVVPTRA
jgi:sensory rhodopsin